LKLGSNGRQCKYVLFDARKIFNFFHQPLSLQLKRNRQARVRETYSIAIFADGHADDEIFTQKIIHPTPVSIENSHTTSKYDTQIHHKSPSVMAIRCQPAIRASRRFWEKQSWKNKKTTSNIYVWLTDSGRCASG
jgi:hypothetical protein